MSLFDWLLGTPGAAPPSRPTAPRPTLPTPDGGPAQAPITGADPAPIKGWSHPFKNKDNPLAQLTHLAKAAAGFYPIGVNGQWHGGVHFDGGTAGTLDQSSVHCLADGEVVAYRMDHRSPSTSYIFRTLPVEQVFSRNFVLVRHRLQAPPVSGSADIPPALTFYSLYMHLQDLALYQADEAMARPAFWPVAALHHVKATAKDSHPDQPERRGLAVRSSNWHSRTLDVLPHGAAVTVSGSGHHRKLENTPGPMLLQGADGQLLGYLAANYLEPGQAGEYRISKGVDALNVRAEPNGQSPVLAKLPGGAEVSVSGDGPYRKLEFVPQYVDYASLDSTREPLGVGSVVVLEQPIAIKAGALIGHIGPYAEHNSESPDYKLHLEVFSCDDARAFLENSRAWAQRLPDSSKTWLKIAKGAAVVTHQEIFNSQRPPSLFDARAVTGADLLLPKHLLDALRVDCRIRVPAMYGDAPCNWYRLEGLLNDADNNILNGWVCEEIGVTPWFSPWSWEGYALLMNHDQPRQMMASFLRATQGFDEQQTVRYGALADAADKGPMRSRLYDLIDRNRDGKLTAEEISTAIKIPAHAQSISQLVIRYESEWLYKPYKWDALDEILGHSGSTPHTNWLAEKGRIKELCWWDEVAPKLGLPLVGGIWHFHPVGLGNWLSAAHPLAISAEELKALFPKAEDADIEAVLIEINPRLMEFKLDARLRQRHFFAQIKGEVGDMMKGRTESWQYSPEKLK